MDTLWVMSNRQDNRVVLWDRDPAYPGGEVFVGGSAPARAARTPLVEGLLREGLLVEVPEPLEGPRKPHPVKAVAEQGMLNLPGQKTLLGREPDPALFGEAEQKAVTRAVRAAPREIAVPRGVEMPPPEEGKS